MAQERTGKILGTVTDQSGAVVPDAKVVVTSPATPRGFETTTDSAGSYVFQTVPVGVYTITVSKAGFTTAKQVGIEVKLGSEVPYNVKLSVGQVSEVVEVTESNVLLETTSSRTVTNIGTAQLENLAHGHSFHHLLALAPGVRPEVKGGNAGVGGISVDGASGSENAFYIDGVEVSDLRSGALRQQNAIPGDFVQDVNVKSGGFEAEYGGATGGVVNVVTKSGSDEYHGRLDFQLTNNQLNARDRGYWQRSPLNQDRADFFVPKEDTYRILYPSFSFGGPILKQKLFFYESYSPEFERTERSVSYVPPVAANLQGNRQYVQERIRHYNFDRIDYNASSRLQFNSSWVWAPARRKGSLPSRDGRIAGPTNDQSIQGEFIPSQLFSAGANWAATNHFLVSARFGYKYQNDKTNNYGLPGDPFIRYETASSAATGVPSNVAGSAGFTNVSSTFGVLRDIQTRHMLYLDGSWVKSLAGQQHTIKLGYALNRVGNNVEDDYTNGYFRIYWGEAYSRGSINNARGQYGYYLWEDGVRHKAAVTGRNMGVYIQDSWRINPRLTVNAGVRLEDEYLPPYKKEVGGRRIANPVSFGFTDKVAPRLGAAWDIMGNGKWKLSGSFGVFYDVMKYELARGSFGGDYWFTHVYRLDNPNVYALGKGNPGAGGQEIIAFDNRTIPINAAGELEGIDPNIKPYKSREFTGTLEHQISNRMSASIRYSRKELLTALEDIGVLDNEDNEVYLIGNPGFGETRNAKSVYGGKTPNGKEWLVPKAVRQYDGVEFGLRGRATTNLYADVSYTYSRLYGNYSGLANADESGRSDPGVSRAYDLPYYYFDASGSQKNVLGRLPLDRPHVFKLHGFYDLKTAAGTTTFGLTQFAFSGTPDSTSVIYLSAPTFPNGRGDLGRTPTYTQTDIAVGHTIKVTERVALRFEGNIRNLFNQNAVISRVTQLNRSSAITDARLPLSRFFAGYKVSDYVFPGSTSPPYNPIWGLPAGNYRNGGGPGATLSSAFSATFPNFGGYQDFRVIRLGVRLQF